MAVQRDYYHFITLPVVMLVTAILMVVSPSLDCSYGLRYSVGDSLWTIPPTPDYFSNWYASIFFKIGDSLVFDFETGLFNVVRVSRQEYESCTALNPMKMIYRGPAILSLSERGVFYFICNISNYCFLGQKISITVHDCPKKTLPSPSLSPFLLPSPVPAVPPSQAPKRSQVPSTEGGPACPGPSTFGAGNTPKALPVHKSKGSADRAKFAFCAGSIPLLYLIVVLAVF